MLRNSSFRGMLTVVSMATLGALALGQYQGIRASEEDVGLQRNAGVLVPVVFQGVVLGPGGAPVEGAVVSTSAGGMAVTDSVGGYRLQVDVPRDATSVQVTAAAARGSDLVASTSVSLPAASGNAKLGPLWLPAAPACPCAPGWIPTFGGQPGVAERVDALAVFDDGSGPALYAGGLLYDAGGVPVSLIAKWDGTNWSALGSGLTTYNWNIGVLALAVYDDGGGSALYAGGKFSTAGALPASWIARWDGTSWSALGSGTGGTIHALAVFDDGSGAALYAGGTFTTAGGAPASRIAKWDGSSWSALGNGLDDPVYALAVHDDGSGPALYAAGSFTSAGGVAANHIARWDGTSWSALGSGVDGVVRALAVFDGGGGPALHAGGSFTSAGGVAANRIARWDGSSWASLGSGTSAAVFGLGVFDDGSGAALYAGGTFSTAGGMQAHQVAKWDGSSWAALGSGLPRVEGGSVQAFAAFDDGGGQALYAGGSIAHAIVRWDGSSWSTLGNGLDSSVEALAVFDDGGGPALYAGGDFDAAHGVQLNRIGKWDGTSWSALGSGISPYGSVLALAGFDDGTGSALYAAGAFSSMGGVAANRIARWDGSSWGALGTGVGGPAYERVFSLAVHDDGGGPALFAGGSFTTAGGVPASSIAKWNGSSWSSVGAPGMFTQPINALAVYDDGSGEALYAGGDVSSAGGIAFARWDGATWSRLDMGIDRPVRALAVFDDGGGPALYAGGDFTTAGGVTVNGIAKWNGSSWSALGSGMGGEPVVGWMNVLAAYDDGSGPALFVGGNISTAGGVAANYIAKWDGASWSSLGSGLSSRPLAFAEYDDGSGAALYVGGSFLSALDSGDSFLAKWSCNLDLDTSPPTLSCPSSVLVGDRIGTPPGEIVTFSVTASDCKDPSPQIVCVPPSGSFFPIGTTLVTCTATDAFGNRSSCRFPVTVARGIRPPPR